MKNTKAQAALEFLTTYGWAILVVMVAIGALAYFGVLNPSKSLPERVVFGNGLSSNDALLAKDDQGNSFARVKLLNGLGNTIYITDVLWSSGETEGDCYSPYPSNILADAEFEVVCVLSDITSDDKLKVNIDVKFTKTEGGFEQISRGEIYAQAQDECTLMDGTDYLHCSDGMQNCNECGLDDCTCISKDPIDGYNT